MAIVQALLAALFRSAGRILNTAFGWATVMLFGKVPEGRQLYLSAMAFGSVVWLIAVVAIAFPSVGTFLFAFVTLPPWVDKTWVRLGMAVAAVVIPAVVGWLSTLVVAREDRPRGAKNLMAAVGRGYPYTFGLALTLVILTVLAPVVKVRNLARRWTAHHVPLMIEPEHYLEVLDDVEHALAQGGLTTERRRASWVLRFPTKILTLFARHGAGRLTADQLTRLTAPDLEILVHPSDVVISGRQKVATRARAILSEHLTFTKAYLTWTKEANEFEDRLRELWTALRARQTGGLLARLEGLERRLATLEVSYEEWDVLFRQLLLVERALYRSASSTFVKRQLVEHLVAAVVAVAPMVGQATEAVKEAGRLGAQVEDLLPRRRPEGALARVRRLFRRAA